METSSRARLLVDGAHGWSHTLVAVAVLKLPLGAAILLGAVLAPTDPVLASDVQVTGPEIATGCGSPSPVRPGSTTERHSPS